MCLEGSYCHHAIQMAACSARTLNFRSGVAELRALRLSNYSVAIEAEFTKAASFATLWKWKCWEWPNWTGLAGLNLIFVTKTWHQIVQWTSVRCSVVSLSTIADKRSTIFCKRQPKLTPHINVSRSSRRSFDLSLSLVSCNSVSLRPTPSCCCTTTRHQLS